MPSSPAIPPKPPSMRVAVCKYRPRALRRLLRTLLFAMCLLPLLLLLASPALGHTPIRVDPDRVTVALLGQAAVDFYAEVNVTGSIELRFNSTPYFSAKKVLIDEKTRRGSVFILGERPTSEGFLEVGACAVIRDNQSTPCPFNTSSVFARVTVVRSLALDLIVSLVGWLYFFAWSISFYPQMYLNWKRKSVIGLNFDFLGLNLIGFAAYSVYNVEMYWNGNVQAEYQSLHPRAPLPVLLNDVVFAIHAVAACLFTVLQATVYERENQRLSRTCMGWGSVLIAYSIGAAGLNLFGIIKSLDFVNQLSYVKMAVTLSKYFPQAVFNYRRKSTVGWSIGNILLDFTGGSLDILQMALQAHNADNWSGFIGNPVKFGLGLVSIIFDVVFIVQHYVLYRGVEVAHNEYGGIDNDNGPPSEVEPDVEYGSVAPTQPIRGSDDE